MTDKKGILISEDNPLFDPFDDSMVNKIDEKIANGELKTTEEVIAYLKSI